MININERLTQELYKNLLNIYFLNTINNIKNNIFYKNHFKNIDLDKLKSIDDLKSLPFLTKNDFRDTYPLGLCCVDKSDLVEMHMSSGSTGDPIVMAYNEHDLQLWSECMSKCFSMMGLTSNDILQITPTFGLFNGGFGGFHGARKLGMFIIPASSGNTERQIKLMRDFNVTAIMALPSYLSRIIEVLDNDKNGNHDIPSLRVAMTGAEACSNELRKKIEKRLHIETFDTYGMTETGGIGTTGQDCHYHNGIHIFLDQYIIEVINPKTGKLVNDGEYGELVFTSLTRQALPIIRYRTGDISRIISREKCKCGRTTLRIDTLYGRSDDMLIIKGINVYPKLIEESLLQIPGVKTDFQIHVSKNNKQDNIFIDVEAEDNITWNIISQYIKEKLGFTPSGQVLKIGTLPRFDGKAKRILKDI